MLAPINNGDLPPGECSTFWGAGKYDDDGNDDDDDDEVDAVDGVGYVAGWQL